MFYLKIYSTVYIGQFSHFAMKFKKKKIFLTENLNNYAPNFEKVDGAYLLLERALVGAWVRGSHFLYLL